MKLYSQDFHLAFWLCVAWLVHWVGKLPYWLFKQKSRGTSHIPPGLFGRKSSPPGRVCGWNRIACVVRSIIAWLKVEEQNAQCGTLFYLLACYCSPWMPCLFFASLWLPCCHSASVPPVSLLLPCVTPSVGSSHGSPARREVEGGEPSLREAFKTSFISQL